MTLNEIKEIFASKKRHYGGRAPIDGEQLLDRRGVHANVAVP
jgi:hypothetical protein